MTKWEYRIESCKEFDVDILTILGEQGWELVSVNILPDSYFNKVYTFKRELKE